MHNWLLARLKLLYICPLMMVGLVVLGMGMMAILLILIMSTVAMHVEACVNNTPFMIYILEIPCHLHSQFSCDDGYVSSPKQMDSALIGCEKISYSTRNKLLS